MARFKKFVSQNSHKGEITYADGIVDGIVLLALENVPDVEIYKPSLGKRLVKKPVEVRFDKEGVFVDVLVKIHYTQKVSEMAFKVQEIVRHNVETMTDYNIAGVNVIVCGVTFNEEKVQKTEN